MISGIRPAFILRPLISDIYCFVSVVSSLRLSNNSGSSKRKNSTIRASSAISDKNQRNVTSGTLKSRTLRGIGAAKDMIPAGAAGVSLVDDRPNTTHTFRSDLVHVGGGGGGGGGGTTPSANRRQLTPPEANSRNLKSGVTASAQPQNQQPQQLQQQQQQQQQLNNNTSMGFGLVGHSDEKPIMLTGTH